MCHDSTRSLRRRFAGFFAAPLVAQPCCEVSDNGTGTADLPPNCPPDGYVGELQLIEGLPPGSSVQIDATLTDFVSVQSPGGVFGGTIETWSATLTLDIVGTGTLTGFNRVIPMAVTGETHTEPRVPGAPIQDMDFRVMAFDGILTGDWDFSLLWFERDLRISPGHTTLIRQGGPGSSFAASSSFEYNYRIQFEGQQESLWLEGFRGITLDLTNHFDLCETNVAAVPDGGGPSPIGLAAYPNPTRGAASLQFRAPAGGAVVSLFDSRGRQLRAWPVTAEGAQSLTWDGTDDNGRPTPAGIYWMRVVTATGTQGVRIVRLSR